MPLYTDTSTWRYWVVGTGSTTSSTSTTAWQNWANNTTSTSTTSANMAWSAWVTDSQGRRWEVRPGQRICVENVWYEWNTGEAWNTGATLNTRPYRAPTTEELEAERQRRIAAEARAAEERKLRLEAEARAEAFLQAHLDEEQRKELAERNLFHVIAPSGRRYAIHRGIAGNVRCENRRYCAHGRNDLRLPAPDHMLMQKLMLETDEERFLAVANVS